MVKAEELEKFKMMLAEMRPRQQTYEAVKKEMIKRRRWRNHSRGEHFKAEDRG